MKANRLGGLASLCAGPYEDVSWDDGDILGQFNKDPDFVHRFHVSRCIRK
jgi:hypothetical protein